MPAIKGWRARILIDGTEVGTAESASVDIDVALDEYFVIGKRQPYTIIEGAQTISGTLDKLWVDTQMLQLIGGGVTPQLTEFDLTVMHTTGSPRIDIYNCKPETLSFDIPADGFVTESLDFRGEYFIYS